MSRFAVLFVLVVERILRQLLYSLFGRSFLLMSSLRSCQDLLFRDSYVVCFGETACYSLSWCSRHDSENYDSFFPQQCCGVVDVTPSGALHSAPEERDLEPQPLLCVIIVNFTSTKKKHFWRNVKLNDTNSNINLVHVFYSALRLESWQHCIDYNTTSARLSVLCEQLKKKKNEIKNELRIYMKFEVQISKFKVLNSKEELGIINYKFYGLRSVEKLEKHSFQTILNFETF